MVSGWQHPFLKPLPPALPGLLHALAHSPVADRPAVEDPHSALTFREMNRRARGLAAGLLEQGVRPGDTVVLTDRPGVGLCTAFLAAGVLGARVLHVHTLLRLPTGIFYAQGVKANVVFFDAKPKDGQIHTKGVWFYDLRTNKHFTLKTRPLKLDDLQDFIHCYHPENRHERVASERFKFYAYEELMARDKASLDIFWLKDDSLDNLDELPPPDVLQQEIIEHLEAALAAFRDVSAGLRSH